MDLIAQKSNGSLFPIEVSLSVIHAETGLQGVAFIVDITERKQMQAEYLKLLEERQRLKELEIEMLQKFLVNAAHDLKTPLAVIMTKLYMVKRSGAESSHQHIHSIEQNVKRLSQLIDNMLFMARLDATDRVELVGTNINNLLLNTLKTKSNANDKNITVDYSLDDSLPLVNVNENLLSVALDKIIDNAIIYTPENGKIQITTRNSEDRISIIVSDTGIGIPEKEIPFIFDHFYRVDAARQMNESFNGLGLTMVKRIIDLHQGMIDVKSELNAGSSFHISFPKQR